MVNKLDTTGSKDNSLKRAPAGDAAAMDTEGNSMRRVRSFTETDDQATEPAPAKDGEPGPDGKMNWSDRNLKQDVAPVSWNEPAAAKAAETDTEGNILRRVRSFTDSDEQQATEPAPAKDGEPGPDDRMSWSDRNLKQDIAPVRW
jgi:hypothetical protein